MYKRWDDIVASGGVSGTRWASVKLPKRAVEKTVRCYGQVRIIGLFDLSSMLISSLLFHNLAFGMWFQISSLTLGQVKM